jgi:hypothetical protein
MVAEFVSARESRREGWTVCDGHEDGLVPGVKRHDEVRDRVG